MDAMNPERKLTRAEKGEVRGAGFVVGGRDRKGMLTMVGRPFEHPSRAAAIIEAERLAKANPGRTFVVLEQVYAVLEDRVK